MAAVRACASALPFSGLSLLDSVAGDLHRLRPAAISEPAPVASAPSSWHFSCAEHRDRTGAATLRCPLSSSAKKSWIRMRTLCQGAEDPANGSLSLRRGCQPGSADRDGAVPAKPRKARASSGVDSVNGGVSGTDSAKKPARQRKQKEKRMVSDGEQWDSETAIFNGTVKTVRRGKKAPTQNRVESFAETKRNLIVGAASPTNRQPRAASDPDGELSDGELGTGTYYSEDKELSRRSSLLQLRRKKGDSVGEDRVTGDEGSAGSLKVSSDEKDLRFLFMEYLMDRVRNRDVFGAEQAMTEMRVVGLRPGPYAYHGLLVAHARAGDTDGALQVLRRQLAAGVKPLPETFTSLVRLFGSIGSGKTGLEILAAMETARLNPQSAWLVLVEELINAGHLKDANEVFLTGSKGIKATQHVCDLLLSRNCDAGDHANAINVLEVMEIQDIEATTYHYNFLLKAQVNANQPDIAAMTLEEVQSARDNMKPDVESYNWVIQGYTRNNEGDRGEDVVDILGQMIEDSDRVQPNARTYALAVECYVKYNAVNEAVRHFRALSRIPGAIHILHNHGGPGDPLSLYLRSLTLQGRIMELLQALELMEKENIPLSSRAMLVSRKGRSLVSSWIEPLREEVDIGCEIDYVAKFIQEGGLTGTRIRWIPSSGSKQGSCDPDHEGFRFGPPLEISFKEHCEEMCRMYNVKRIEKLTREGAQALGPDATEDDLDRVKELLNSLAYPESLDKQRKPKAASKMLVSELKEELEAQGLPTDATRPVLYQRVQKARRINRARGRPLWMPPVDETAKVDERALELASRLTLKNDSAEYWKRRFLDDDISESEISKIFVKDEMGKISFGPEFMAEDEEEDGTSKAKDSTDEVLDEAEDDSAAESSASSGGKEDVEEPYDEALYELLGYRKEWKPLTLEKKFSYLRKRKYHVLGLKTLDEAWNWTWEKDIRIQEPEQWSQEREVKLGMRILEKVVKLGGLPTIGDCAMLLRASMRVPLPDAMVNIIQESHKLGHVFGSNLYNEAVNLCMSAGEKDAAIAIIADMEEAGKVASTDLLNQVLAES